MKESYEETGELFMWLLLEVSAISLCQANCGDETRTDEGFITWSNCENYCQ